MLPMAKPTARQPRKWSVTEDQKLREEVEAQMSEGEVKDWCRIAAKLPGRTNKDCRKRWHNSVAGGLKKGQWAKNEDLQLSIAVQKFGQRWTLVAEVVGSRSADQCAKRWQQSLDPELDRSEWREQEDQVLISAVNKLGRHWKDIQHHHFPGRSKNCIKNRYTVLLRRYQNLGIPLPGGTDTPETDGSGNRVSIYSATDDDAMSCNSSLYNENNNLYSQVSTPETRSSWTLEDERYPAWPSPDLSNFGSLDHLHHPAPVSSSSQWEWSDIAMSMPTTSSVGSPALMTLGSSPRAYPASTNDYFGAIPPAVSVSPYSSFSGQKMLAPTSIPSSRPERPSSFPGTPSRHPHSLVGASAAPYQNPDAMARFYKYAVQADQPYGMQ